VSQFQEASMAERCRTQIEITIDDMIAAGKSEQEILAVIRHEYRPYDTMPEFDEGFADYQARRRDKDYDGVAGQAYDRGANAALWLWQALQRMKLAAK
jgi:hypothetical protein